jgi:uncharacterized protein (TIGR01244 family)
MRMPLLGLTVATAVLSAGLSAQVTKQELTGVRNFTRVDATVGCAGAVDPAAMGALRKEGFVSVINLREATEQGADVDASRTAAQTAGLKYIHLPFNAAKPDTAVVDRFLAAVADKANQPVFIHCGSANRVGAMWMIKRALQDGWPIEKAQAEGQAVGLTNPQLVAFATEYIKTQKR